MDMREGSAMTEASGLSTEQGGVENASGAMPGTAKEMRGQARLDSRSASRCGALRRSVAQTDFRGSTTVALDGVLARRTDGSTAIGGRGMTVISHRTGWDFTLSDRAGLLVLAFPSGP